MHPKSHTQTWLITFGVRNTKQEPGHVATCKYQNEAQKTVEMTEWSQEWHLQGATTRAVAGPWQVAVSLSSRCAGPSHLGPTQHTGRTRLLMMAVPIGVPAGCTSDVMPSWPVRAWPMQQHDFAAHFARLP